jgi:hypothetical protein
MTNAKDKAYPVSATAAKQIIDGYGFPDEYLGLTKREYFAGQSLITLMAQDLHYKDAAAKAVIMADGLIEALNMSPEELLKYDK